ncbi:surface layer protein NpdA [Acidovorax sp. SUPP2539]|uniref:surface layer protein NpdA n=1 Tax=Acidovorax sp. SUPP2539 TaxID=2920878 RepID=UPI0023DE4CE4|nr:surface layer protein NpdA [Acidovorax sp. SUPP2539]GKS92449.1 surface layer protein NpdA [Acidovorax sp. SUPP2539]
MPIQKIAAACALLCSAGFASSALAGVIAGTGGTPSSSVMGTTDATTYAIAESGPGHSLVVPYFTAQNGQMTVLHLVNTDLNNGKAVKLRFRGANNGDGLLHMTVLLAPGDVWTGAVTAGANGIAQLTTADATCTSPRLAPGVAQAFVTERLNPLWTANVQANHTREGAIEAIVAADIPAAAVYGTGQQERSALFTAIRPVNGTAPCTDAALNAALLEDTSAEATAASRGLATPTGGVAGTWYIIDVPNSTTFSGAATAIRAVNNAGRNARGNYVLFPPTAQAVTAPERYTADPLLVSAGFATRVKNIDGETSEPTNAAVIQARYYDLPDLSTPYYLPAGERNARRTAGDLSAQLAATEVMNQYATDPSISARTDWVLSMPTKRYSVAYDYSQPPAVARVYSVVPPSDLGSQYFSGDDTQVKTSPESVCSQWNLTYFDRQTSTKLALSPVVACGTVATLGFQEAGRSGVSASITAQPRSDAFVSGWASIATNASDGRPIIGAALLKLTNPNATPGVAGNYGLTMPHMYKAP